MILWRSIIIWVICTVFIAPLPQQTPLECDIKTITPSDNSDSIVFISIHMLTNNKFLYVTSDKDANRKLWVINEKREVEFVTDIDVYYSMVLEMRVYQEQKVIYLSEDKDTDIISLEQIDLQTHAHEVLFEEIYYASMFLRGDWLFVPISHNKTVARNMITEEQVTLAFEEAGGQGSVKPLVKITETQWLFYKDDHIFVADLTTGIVQELTNDAIKVQYSDPVYAIYEDTLVFIRNSDKQLVQIALDGTLQQEMPLQGDGDYKYLQATEQGVTYTFSTKDAGSHLYFVNLTNNGAIIHPNANTDTVSSSHLVTSKDGSDATNGLWYLTKNEALYYVELTPPFTAEFIKQEDDASSIRSEVGHIVYHTNRGYVTVSNDRTHIQTIGTHWGYGISTDDKVYFREEATGDILRYDYVANAVEKLGTIEGEDIRLFPVPGEDFLYFQSDDNFGILSFDGAISVENGQLRYINEYPVGQDPHWGAVDRLPSGAYIFASNHYQNLTYVQCHS